MAGDRVLRGTVGFGQHVPCAPNAVLHVLVEAVPHADAAAVVVARLDMGLGNAVSRGTRLSFTLPVHEVDAAIRYEVRVHVDRSGTGRVQAGDQVSTRSFPVLTQGAPDEVDIGVEPV